MTTLERLIEEIRDATKIKDEWDMKYQDAERDMADVAVELARTHARCEMLIEILVDYARTGKDILIHRLSR